MVLRLTLPLMPWANFSFVALYFVLERLSVLESWMQDIMEPLVSCFLGVMVCITIDDRYHSGGLLQVINPHGLTLYQDAKLAQFVFHTLAEKVRAHSHMLHFAKYLT